MGVYIMKKVKFLIILFFIFGFYDILNAKKENVCIECHLETGEESLMKPVEEWRKSVHSENGISCHHCHGGDPNDEDIAMAPEAGFIGVPEYEEIPEFCGKCHIGVKENYLKSAHGKTLPDGPNCVTCHTAHNQKKAGVYLINKELCSQCHSYERAEKIKFALLSTEKTISSLSKRIDNLWTNGFDAEQMRKMLFATKNSFRRLTHIVEVDYILQRTGDIYSELGKVENEVKEKEEILKNRNIVGAFIVIFLLISALLFDKLRKELIKKT